MKFSKIRNIQGELVFVLVFILHVFPVAPKIETLTATATLVGIAATADKLTKVNL